MSEVLKKRIMDHEGFRNTVYLDSLKKATIGYGHLVTKKDNFIEGVEYKEKDLRQLFYQDFEKAETGADQIIGHISELHPEAKNIIIEMVFQLGTMGVRKFSKMLLALEEKNYYEAHLQMLDSRWRKQTKTRCESLAKIMKECA
jgi:lysozyme|tara:strand:- start:3447 stop:3878 length:432 start_codon:yes stop_codon:yes gene_type:complete